jgi:hypothetical protein
MRIQMPFLYSFKEPLLTGIKVCTSRTRKMGKPGDTFTAFGQEFQINYVWGTSLGIVAKTLWAKEGVKSPLEFEGVWREIHPRKGFDPGQLVYVHNFSRVDPEHRYPFRPCETCEKPFIPTWNDAQGDCSECMELRTPHDEGDEGL